MKKPGPRSASPIDLHVGTRIRIRRQLMNMTQEKLGENLGVTFQQVQKYERGTNRVGASRLWNISRVLDVPVSFFYDGLEDNHEYEQVAENKQMPVVYDFINSSDGVAFAKAVSKIKNKAVRRQLLELARSLADSDGNETG
ncbi:MAG: helix-turn-helix transcriptional regulator [Maricaulaceae bacterium]